MRTAAWILIAAALTACVTFVEPSASLEEARALYRQAAADSLVQQRAPVELAIAERALAQAERSWRDHVPEDLVDHQANIAGQRARLAIATAQYRSTEARIATSREPRSRLLIEAREREAAEARSRAAAEVEAARAAAEAESAEAHKSTDLAAELARLQSQVPELKARQTERGWVLTLHNELLFDGGKATLKPGAGRATDNLARFLRDNPGRDIAIEGFTDSIGPSAANRRLSEQRAQAVKDALVARGIEPRRIDARGYGPSFPVATNETPGGRQLNRRVEIVINPS